MYCIVLYKLTVQVLDKVIRDSQLTITYDGGGRVGFSKA